MFCACVCVFYLSQRKELVSLSEALLRLDMAGAVKDIRRANFVCKASVKLILFSFFLILIIFQFLIRILFFQTMLRAFFFFKF